ncbi:Uma2 family endonuclease [Streptomyces sp. NPDC018059]|uniref:Uma2 family endonuclease n=1 Tax=Streptomyces sp. NPDC018059 TaxID=3365041 RepID=UPI0037A258DE
MSADPITEPSMLPQQDPIDLLLAFEEASEVPIRPEYFEGMGIVPPQADDEHNDVAFELCFRLRLAGVRLVGMGNGYRVGPGGGPTTALVVHDFYVHRRRPTELDETYREAHLGWYSAELLALAGEVTSNVLLHRQDGKAYAYSDPVQEEDPAKAHYATKVEGELGHPLPLPEPYPKLDTAFLVGEQSEE